MNMGSCSVVNKMSSLFSTEITKILLSRMSTVSNTDMVNP